MVELNKLKVCVVCRSVGTVVAGGIETYVREVYSRISEEEDISIVTGKGEEPKAFRELKKRVKTYRYPFISRHNPFSRILTKIGIPIYDDEVEVLSLIPFLLFHFLFHRYNVVVVDNPFLVPVVKLMRLKCVFVNQGSIGGNRYFFIHTFRPDLSISCSDFIRKDLLAKFGIDSVVIYNGVNPDDFKKKSSKVRERYGIGCDILILGVGRLVQWKNFHTMIEIFSRLPENNKLVIIGDGLERENLSGLVKELGLEGRVTFTGVVDRGKIPSFFAASDVFALMSKGEAFGVVYVEAMAAGKPIITYRMGAAPEIMDKSFALLLEDGDSVDTMAKKVAAFLKRDLKKMGSLARKRAKHFAWGIAAKKTLKTLRTL